MFPQSGEPGVQVTPPSLLNIVVPSASPTIPSADAVRDSNPGTGSSNENLLIGDHVAPSSVDRHTAALSSSNSSSTAPAASSPAPSRKTVDIEPVIASFGSAT